jgi:hypothetical protein
VARERRLEPLGAGRLGHLRQCLEQLLLGAQQVAQLIDEQLFEHLGHRPAAGGAIVDARLATAVAAALRRLAARVCDCSNMHTGRTVGTIRASLTAGAGGLTVCGGISDTHRTTGIRGLRAPPQCVPDGTHHDQGANVPRGGCMTTRHTRSRTPALSHAISPGQHAVLDYGVAGTFIAFGLVMLPRHRPAALLALANGAMVLGMSLLTDYPGGVFRKLSFRAHRTGDIGQAALAGLGPILLGFADEPEATFFYGQAASEAGVIAATDWDAAAHGRD